MILGYEMEHASDECARQAFYGVEETGADAWKAYFRANAEYITR